MIAADTSTWIAFFEGTLGADVHLLDQALADRQVLMVPVVLTELLSDESYRHAAGALGARIQGELSERDPADRVLDLLWECELTTHQAI